MAEEIIFEELGQDVASRFGLQKKSPVVFL